MSWLFESGGQSIGTSASASVLPMNIQGWELLPQGYFLVEKKMPDRSFRTAPLNNLRGRPEEASQQPCAQEQILGFSGCDLHPNLSPHQEEHCKVGGRVLGPRTFIRFRFHRWGLPQWSASKESVCNAGDIGKFSPWIGQIP